jgi:hypothetical protein
MNQSVGLTAFGLVMNAVPEAQDHNYKTRDFPRGMMSTRAHREKGAQQQGTNDERTKYDALPAFRCHVVLSL